MSLARAIETGDLAELPSRRDEDWHWTDLRGLIRELPEHSRSFETVPWRGPFAAVGGDEVTFANGGMTDGVPLREYRGAGHDVLQLRFLSDADDTSHSAVVVLEVEEGRSMLLLESYEGRGKYVESVELTLEIEPRAHVTRIVLADDAVDGVLVSQARVILHLGATFTQTVLTSGARRQRIETRVTHPGHGAEARLDGVYLLEGRRHADITTVVTHEGVDGTTNQLIKGVVTDQARGVFQGRIVVRPGADRTDAKMGHHALVLSDRAEVDAKPELEIFADDVVCAHGNTVGALDEDSLFYAEQRGIPTDEAKAMLTEAFVAEVVDRIEHEGAREVVRAWVAERLGMNGS